MAKVQGKKSASAKNKKKKPETVSYHKKPDKLETKKWQIALRRQFATTQSYIIVNEGEHPVYSDFLVSNPTFESTYKVAIRSKNIGENFCACPDFKSSNLGTCKHIEWTLNYLGNKRGFKKYFKTPPTRAYSSVYLHYDEQRTIRLRIGTECKPELEALALEYFDAQGVLFPHAYLDFEHFLEKARAIHPDLRCYDDALEFILQQRETQSRARRIAEIEQHSDAYFKNLLNVELFPYQKEGILFAARASRCLIADEMGLGKTVQALGAAELLRQEQRVANTLIVCPTSLKYQWKTEIEKFTGASAVVIEGPQIKRKALYENDHSFFKIITYNVVVQDARLINNILSPDLIILDEAQRFKNWNTKISRAVKSLNIRYRFVLTGTPLENKIEELYSIVQFVDPYILGPLYSFLERHQVKDPESGRVIGYQDLGAINKALQPVMIRRLKKNVLKQLPERMDKNLFVPMTKEQNDMHRAYADEVAKLVAKWRRFHFLSEQDRNRLLSFLNLMKMSCDSTFVVDQKTRHDTKIDELMCILEEALVDEEVKVVVFSQWERMTRLVAQELRERDIPFESLHGGVDSTERGNMLIRFNETPECRIFLSTDAGGVGLNLQSASLLINLDVPWNPAVLEQRIGRIYRMGQERRVNVINLVSIATLEHRLLDTLKFKASMAAGVLDNGAENIFLGEDRFKEFMHSVETLTQSVGTDAEVDVISPIEDTEELVGAGKTEESNPESDFRDAPAVEAEPETTPIAPQTQEQGDSSKRSTQTKPTTESPTPQDQRQGQSGHEGLGSRGSNSDEMAPPASAQELVSMGVNFLSGLSQTLSSPEKTAELVNSLVEKDAQTGQTYLKIPVQSQEVVSNALQVLGALFGGVRK
ncbi:DEAD/DEAH box helicase [Haliscomenobacter hydrossis]|uniref:SNF2-related protein n=1 Tax=Haliscomenobacter hydrossis (strain ATCC 27775 / DSM 1100 / LMG 10767 / O) TaxID=760192 RepID=F4KQ11_HALH1|nr:SNF2-related protein [Haliscomenobacter hydrossis]AEE53215.1 SNF2-related protein [Haliscomenobacter hydrossis DSM 1100]